MIDSILTSIKIILIFLGLTCLLFTIAMLKEVKRKNDND